MSLLKTVPQSRPTAEKMLLNLKRCEENGDATTCSPLLPDSPGTDTKPMVSAPCSSKCLVGIGTLVMLAIVGTIAGLMINWYSTAYSTNTTPDTFTTSASITTTNPRKKSYESFQGCGIVPGKKDVD